MTIKIAIADDHPMIIKGVQNMLSNYPDIQLIQSYPNGKKLLEGLQKEQPDVLLLDIQLPDKAGDELAPIILKKYPGIKILALTNFEGTLYVHNMLRHGVQGYILKNVEEEVFIEAIEKVYNGEIYIETSIREKMNSLNMRVEKTPSSKSMLTPKEKEILQLIVNGYTSPEIADKLFLGLRTVENYRVSILLKMDVKNTATLVKKALRLGLAE
jgi:DNA-binding NarL/FixJ family response regulator